MAPKWLCPMARACEFTAVARPCCAEVYSHSTACSSNQSTASDLFWFEDHLSADRQKVMASVATLHCYGAFQTCQGANGRASTSPPKLDNGAICDVHVREDRIWKKVRAGYRMACILRSGTSASRRWFPSHAYRLWSALLACWRAKRLGLRFQSGAMHPQRGGAPTSGYWRP